MQKKDDKVGNTTVNKEGKEEKKIERERKIEIDSQKSPRPNLCVKTKKLFNYIRLAGKYPFFLAKLVFSHSYAY